MSNYNDQDFLFDNDVNQLVDANKKTGVLNGVQVSADSGMQVQIAAGSVSVAGTKVDYAGGTATITAADSTNPRKDIITIDSSGTITVTAGTPEAAYPVGKTARQTVRPAPPNTPSDEVLLAEIWVGSAVTEITSDNIKDLRILIKQVDGTSLTETDGEMSIESSIQSDISSNTASRHTQNTDTILDEGGANETTAADIRGHIDSSVAHGTTGNVVGTTDTQTLTNKTLNDSSNDIHADATHISIRNNTGSTLTKGTPVYVSGYNIGTELAEVTLSRADDPSTIPAIGLVEEDILNNENGDVIIIGTLTGCNTSSWSVGDDLYVDSTGGLTNSKPTGTNKIQKIAQVTRSNAAVGVIEVFGAGRSNDLPNIPNGYIWRGDGSGVPEEVAFDTEVSNNSDVSANTTHRTSDGTDHANVVLNDAHRGTTAGNPHQVTLEEARSQNNQISGTIDANTNKIENLATPTADGDAASKEYVDGKIQGLDWQESVSSFYDPTSGLPGTPSTGDRYIASATANGWTTNYIYEYNGSSWDETVSNEGQAVWVEDLDKVYTFNGSSWVTFGSTVLHNNTSGKQGGTTDEYYHLTDSEHTDVQSMISAAVQNLTSAEVSQLANINSVTISNTQWGYVGDMNQGVATSDSPDFAGLTLTPITDTNGLYVYSAVAHLVNPLVYILMDHGGSTEPALQIRSDSTSAAALYVTFGEGGKGIEIRGRADSGNPSKPFVISSDKTDIPNILEVNHIYSGDYRWVTFDLFHRSGAGVVTNPLSFNTRGNQYIGSANNNDVYLTSIAGESGLVKIGEVGTAPTAKLHIQPGTAVTGLLIDQDQNAKAFNILADCTTSDVIQVDANSLTTGRIASYYSNSASLASTNGMVQMIADNTGSTANVLYLQNDGTGTALYILQVGNASQGLYIDDRGINHGLRVDSSGIKSGDRFTATFENDNASNTQAIVRVYNAGIGNGVLISQIGAGIGLNVDQAAVASRAAQITNAGTRQGLYLVQSGVLDGGNSGLQVYTNTAQTTGDALCKIWNDASGSTIPTAWFLNDGTNAAVLVDQNGLLSSGTNALYVLNDITAQTTGDAIVRIRNAVAGTTIPTLKLQTTGTGEGLLIDMDGDAKGLVIDSEATTSGEPSAAISVYTGSGATCIHYEAGSNANGYGLLGNSPTGGNAASNYFFRDNASSDCPMFRINQTNASDTNAVMEFIQDGPGDAITVDINGDGSAVNIDADANSANNNYGIKMNVQNAGAGVAHAIDFSGGCYASAAVSGTQDRSIRISVGGTTYYIPAYTSTA